VKSLKFLLSRLSPQVVWFGCELVLLSVISGCASTDESIPEWAGVKGDGQPAKLVNFSETAKFKVRWHTSTGEGGANLLQPTIMGDAIFAASSKGKLTRLNPVTGKLVWQIETGLSVSGGTASGEGLVLVGGNKGDVYAYGEDGELRWKSKVSSEVLNISPVFDGRVLVRSGDGRIAGLNAADGKRIWIYERSTPALVVRSHAGIVIQRGVAYAGFAGGRLAAINIEDGSLLWESFVSQPQGITELERINDITSAPVVDDGQACAIAFQGRIACFDIAQGALLWSRDMSGDKGMMLLRKFLYLTDEKGFVITLDKNTGSTIWKNGLMLLRRNSAPLAVGNFVVVGDFQGYLHGLNREDGSFAARIELDKGGAVLTSPLALDDGLLVQTRNGELYSLSIH